MDKHLETIQDNQVINEYLSMLLNNNMQKNSKDAKELVDYVAKTEIQLNEVLKELHDIKKVLNEIQNPTTKMRLNEVFEKTEIFINDGKNKIQNTKGQIIQSMKDCLQDFKQKGMNGVVKTINILHFKEGIEVIKKSLFCSLKQIQKASSTIDSMTYQFRKSKNSFKNIGRLLVGKPIQINSYDINKLNIMQKGFRNLFFRLEKVAMKTTHFLNRMNDFEKKSVKKDIECFTHQSKYKKDQSIAKEQSR